MKTIKDASYSEWLVVNAQLGDRRALEGLLQHWHQRLLLYGINKLGEREAAQDALQECLISISKGVGSLREPATFPKWAFRIMERRCQDQLRRTLRERVAQAELTGQSDPSLAEPVSESSTLENNSRSLKQAMQRLAPELSLLLRLYYLEAFNLKDIADITGLPEGTVKSRLFYARKKLAALLED